MDGGRQTGGQGGNDGGEGKNGGDGGGGDDGPSSVRGTLEYVNVSVWQPTIQFRVPIGS